MKSIATALLLLAPLFANASTIQFLGAPTGVNDGTDYVLPYLISIDGVQQSAICYDLMDTITNGQTWTASVSTLSTVASSGYFGGKSNSLAGYEEVAWLSAQTYSDTNHQIALQHAIWGVFGTNTTPLNSAEQADMQSYLNADATAAAGNYAGFNFNNFRFVEQENPVAGKPGTYQTATPGANGTAQAFVFQMTSAPVPEPGTVAMLFGGLLMIGAPLGKKLWGRASR